MTYINIYKLRIQYDSNKVLADKIYYVQWYNYRSPRARIQKKVDCDNF